VSKSARASGVGTGSLAQAPGLVFNPKDDLQARWVRRLCQRDVEFPRHAVPAPHAFVTAALAGMGWGVHAEELVAAHLATGAPVELLPQTALDVPLFWQHARTASSLIDGLSRAVTAAAERALRPAAPCSAS
jgi:LysR family transcriptional regulator (chromosome initiation inhibitor)